MALPGNFSGKGKNLNARSISPKPQTIKQKSTHPWSRAFSAKRLADADCFDVRIPNGKAGEHVGEREALTGPWRRWRTIALSSN